MVNIQTEFAKNPSSVNAMRVVERLHKENYQAYLVGGCVRDLMLGKSPKDFDVATDAHPEAVKALFNSARMVGKRFKIVHVRFGRDIIEVTTFRAPARENEGEVSEGGMLLRDNVWGSFEEDAMRRDFTINALYFDPQTNQITDLVKGMADIDAKLIRLIGEPEQRYREDPVRMLRAARFEAKLHFDIEKQAATGMKRLGYLLQDIPAARLFEEALKLFMSGYGEASYQSLIKHELLGWLFPGTANANPNFAPQLIQLALASTDKRIGEGMPVTPAFVLAALLWWPFVAEKKRLVDEGNTDLAASHEAALNVISQQQLFTSIPKRFSGPMRDIWHLQSRLPNTRGKKPKVLQAHKRFRAAYDFLLLREQSGEKLDNLGAWWTSFQEQNPLEQTDAPTDSRTPGRRPRKRRPRRAT
ncbi:MAG: poly(A) polymerase [Candidatus Azotimanducaceae bacterium]|jgi:poly(A) polymerase